MFPRPRLSVLFGLSALLIALALPVAVRGQTAPAAKPPTPMMTSMVFDWNALTPTPWPTGQRRMVFDGPSVKMAKLECHITTLNAGQISGAPHKHSNEELTIVNDGTLEVSINGKTQTVGKGSVFYFAPQDLAGIRNPSSEPATYTVIEMTVPADAPAAK
jgi:quercetin dioxygenase-like cupin family protein